MIVEWITLGANLAVLAGLILVAVQIRQNSKSIRSAAHQAWVSAATDWNMAIATDDELSAALARGHSDAASLDEISAMQYAMCMLGFMQMTQATYFLSRDGTIDRELWEKERQRAALHLTFPGVRQWWDAGAKTQLSSEFVHLVESTEISSTPWSWEEGQGFRPLRERGEE